MSFEDLFDEYGWERRFRSEVPRGGFELVNPGQCIYETREGFSQINPVSSDEIGNDLQRRCLIAHPARNFALPNVTYRSERPLLMPLTSKTFTKAPFLGGEEPLFQRFANLATESEILDFADANGTLQPRLTREDRFSSGEKATIKLESLALWEIEIETVNDVIEGIMWYEHGWSIVSLLSHLERKRYKRKKPSGSLASVLKNFDRDKKEIQKIFEGSGVLAPVSKEEETIAEFVKEQPHTNILRSIAIVCNHKLRKNMCHPSFRVLPGGRKRAELEGNNLIGSLWLELARSLFWGWPEEMVAHRCYVCGMFCREGMRQRKKGPNSGLWYHERCSNMLKSREKRQRAAEEARGKLRDHSGRKDLLVNDLDEKPEAPEQ